MGYAVKNSVEKVNEMLKIILLFYFPYPAQFQQVHAIVV